MNAEAVLYRRMGANALVVVLVLAIGMFIGQRGSEWIPIFMSRSGALDSAVPPIESPIVDLQQGESIAERVRGLIVQSFSEMLGSDVIPIRDTSSGTPRGVGVKPVTYLAKLSSGNYRDQLIQDSWERILVSQAPRNSLTDLE